MTCIHNYAGSVDVIYASHVLQSFHYRLDDGVRSALRDWYSLLYIYACICLLLIYLYAYAQIYLCIYVEIYTHQHTNTPTRASVYMKYICMYIRT